MRKELVEFLARKYNYVLIEDWQKCDEGDYDLSLLVHGIVCDFEPDKKQRNRLETLHDPINLKNTLFTFDQAVSMDIQDKILAQISEYFLSYGLGGAFIRSSKKTTIDTRLLSGITSEQLENFLNKIIALPIALKSEDIHLLSQLLHEHLGPIDLSRVKNNELKVKLLSEFLKNGERIDGLAGEDLIRFVVMTYTDSALLIKSRDVIAAIRTSEKELVDPQFFFDYAKELAVCFNRFKPILLALRKSPKAKKAINKISHLSKDLHVPVGMPKSRTFIADFMRGDYEKGLPDHFTIYDWFRILNALAARQVDLENDVFQIRNGKVWFQPRKKPVFWRSKKNKNHATELQRTEAAVLEQIKKKLAHLNDENIKLPDQIRLGLPISEKQSIGALPFGTVISMGDFDKEVSAGIYWENKWGARDLDLSLIDISGQRTGWGNVASYQRKDIQFSGDITNAPDGAMEFMTVSRPTSFGLFVNIFSGEIGSKCKLVIGSRDKTKKQWISDIYIGEMTQLSSRGNIIGFMNPDNEYIVYQGRLGSAHSSSPKNKAVIEKALVPLWTLNRLFEAIGFQFDSEAPTTIDLSYDGLSFDKLAQMCVPDYSELVA